MHCLDAIEIKSFCYLDIINFFRLPKRAFFEAFPSYNAVQKYWNKRQILPESSVSYVNGNG